MATPSAEQINRADAGLRPAVRPRAAGTARTPRSARRSTVRDELKQPAGLVHGGVYASIAESMASLGDRAWRCSSRARSAMGLSNSTSFLRPITEGVVHALATRVHRGRTHVGVGRALQRRRRPHVRGHAHDDRRAPRACRSRSRARTGGVSGGDRRAYRDCPGAQRVQRRGHLAGQRRLRRSPCSAAPPAARASGAPIALIGTIVVRPRLRPVRALTA